MRSPGRRPGRSPSAGASVIGPTNGGELELANRSTCLDLLPLLGELPLQSVAWTSRDCTVNRVTVADDPGDGAVDAAADRSRRPPLAAMPAPPCEAHVTARGTQDRPPGQRARRTRRSGRGANHHRTPSSRRLPGRRPPTPAAARNPPSRCRRHRQLPHPRPVLARHVEVDDLRCLDQRHGHRLHRQLEMVGPDVPPTAATR